MATTPEYTPPFTDALDIDDVEILYRRVHPSWIDWELRDEEGKPRIKSAAFQDYPRERAQRMGYPGACMSVGIRSMLQLHETKPAQLLKDDSYGLASFKASDVRVDRQGVMGWPTEDEPWHGIVFSKIGPKRTGAMESALARKAEWVLIPARAA